MQCTGRNQPICRSRAMPSASRRSVLIGIAFSAAFTCRVTATCRSRPGGSRRSRSHPARRRIQRPGGASPRYRRGTTATPAHGSRASSRRPTCRGCPASRSRGRCRHRRAGFRRVVPREAPRPVPGSCGPAEPAPDARRRNRRLRRPRRTGSSRPSGISSPGSRGSAPQATGVPSGRAHPSGQQAASMGSTNSYSSSPISSTS